MIDPKEAARIVERVMTEWGKQDSLRDMLDEITTALLAGEGNSATAAAVPRPSTAEDIVKWLRAWARFMAREAPNPKAVYPAERCLEAADEIERLREEKSQALWKQGLKEGT